MHTVTVDDATFIALVLSGSVEADCACCDKTCKSSNAVLVDRGGLFMCRTCHDEGLAAAADPNWDFWVE